jgi:hypothetical protein
MNIFGQPTTDRLLAGLSINAAIFIIGESNPWTIVRCFYFCVVMRLPISSGSMKAAFEIIRASLRRLLLEVGRTPPDSLLMCKRCTG